MKISIIQLKGYPIFASWLNTSLITNRAGVILSVIYYTRMILPSK
jgi:hypothetical protein